VSALIPQAGHDALISPHDTIVEHALLIARGVRPMALVDVLHVKSEEDATRVYQQLSRYASESGGEVLPFVIRGRDVAPSGSGLDLRLTYCGFAAARWVVDLMRFAVTQAGAHEHQIIGLLLGYSAVAIRHHEECGGKPYWSLG
jgi:hypothetical protein